MTSRLFASRLRHHALVKTENEITPPHDEACVDLEGLALRRRPRSTKHGKIAMDARMVNKNSKKAITSRAASARRMPAIVSAPVPLFMQFIIMSDTPSGSRHSIRQIWREKSRQGDEQHKSCEHPEDRRGCEHDQQLRGQA